MGAKIVGTTLYIEDNLSGLQNIDTTKVKDLWLRKLDQSSLRASAFENIEFPMLKTLYLDRVTVGENAFTGFSADLDAIHFVNQVIFEGAAGKNMKFGNPEIYVYDGALYSWDKTTFAQDNFVANQLPIAGLTDSYIELLKPAGRGIYVVSLVFALDGVSQRLNCSGLHTDGPFLVCPRMDPEAVAVSKMIVDCMAQKKSKVEELTRTIDALEKKIDQATDGFDRGVSSNQLDRAKNERDLIFGQCVYNVFVNYSKAEREENTKEAVEDWLTTASAFASLFPGLKDEGRSFGTKFKQLQDFVGVKDHRDLLSEEVPNLTKLKDLFAGLGEKLM